jgi:hypothetical protein
MRVNQFLVILAGVAFGWISEAQAQAISEEDLLRCRELLETLQPGDVETEEQARCLALLAQLGVQPGYVELSASDEQRDPRFFTHFIPH